MRQHIGSSKHILAVGTTLQNLKSDTKPNSDQLRDWNQLRNYGEQTVLGRYRKKFPWLMIRVRTVDLFNL